MHPVRLEPATPRSQVENSTTEPLSSPQGGGGTLNFSSYVGSGPASTVHQKKNQEFQTPPKNLNFNNPKNYPLSVH